MENDLKKPARVLGILMLVLSFFGGTLKYMIDWNDSESIHYNIWALVVIIGGLGLIIWSNRK